MRNSPSERPAILQALSNGLSEFVGNISFNIIAICYNLQLMKYIGENGVSAYGVLMYIGFIFGSVFIGYNMGISQVISFKYGERDGAELRSLLKKSCTLIAIGGILITVIIESTAPQISALYVGYDAELRDLTTYAMRIYMLSFLICGFNMFASAWFTALNNGPVSAVISFTRTLVFEMGCVFLLPFLFGIDGIWLAVNGAELLALALSVILVISLRKKYGY